MAERSANFDKRSAMSIDQLQKLQDSFWDQEPLVNGLWNGLFAEYFWASGPVRQFIIVPEAVVIDGAQRLQADLGIAYLSEGFSWCLSYEGKKRRGDSWDKIILQLWDRYQNANLGNQTCWGVCAKGSEFIIFLWSAANGGMISLNMQGIPGGFSFVRAGRSVLRGSPPVQQHVYNLVDPADYAVLQAALDAMSKHPLQVVI